jgi:aspartate/methionine/tyrosine aminotransferase
MWSGSAIPFFVSSDAMAEGRVTSLFPTRGSLLDEPWIDTLNSRADALRRAGAPVISLGQAVPGFPPPPSAVRAAARAMEAGRVHAYTADAGIRELRDATAAWLRSVAGGNVDPADGLIITAGANQAFALLALTAFGAGDDVLLASPYFFNHEMMVRAAGATPVEVPMDPASGFRLDAKRILAALTPRTRAVVVVTPANPTGAVATPGEIESLADALAAEHVFLVVDETYLLFTYDAPPWSATALASRANVLAIGSFSKTFAIPGWRLGYLAGDARFISDAMRVQDAMLICAPSVAQQGMIAALADTPLYPQEFLPEFKARRETLSRAVTTAGGEWAVTGGGFFALAWFPNCDDSFAAALRLLDEAHVLTIPGGLFGDAGAGFLRLSYGAASSEVLAEAVGRLARAIR